MAIRCGGAPNPQGWAGHDITAQLKTYFHVDGPSGPGCNGVTAVSGTKSMWCGEPAGSGDPYCGWATLPGYGNSWSQALQTITVNVPATITYSCEWDSEGGYDFTYPQYWDDVAAQWVNATPAGAPSGYYHFNGSALGETFTASGATVTTMFRFNFVSDGAWSDQDGLNPTTEGAFKVDDIIVVSADLGSPFQENFEAEPCGAVASDDGFWTAVPAPPFGPYFALHNALNIVQEDPCLRPFSNLWGFFDDPATTNYACGGFPLQGAMPYGPNVDNLYMNNEVWSPWVPITGSGTQYRLTFLTYRDLPLANLQFYVFSVRTKDIALCPSSWDDFNFVYYGGQKDWLRTNFEVGSFVASGAQEIQVSVGAVDMCGVWCGVFGDGSCHSHAPVIDQVKLVRVDLGGPQWFTRHIDLWQDNFPDEGGVGPMDYARCDAAIDILPSTNGRILPGDSLSFEVTDPSGLADDNTSRPGKAVYAFVQVTDRAGTPDPVKQGLVIQSPDNQSWSGDTYAGLTRFPYVAGVAPAGWSAFRADSCITGSGGNVPNKYCVDLMDINASLGSSTGPYYGHVNEDAAANTGIFAPGDVINYVLAAKNTLGQWSYIYRTLNGQGATTRTTDVNVAISSPMEWSVLPDAGLLPGDQGDILYVDDADDRGGPAQLYFDNAFRTLGIEDRVDRFDVLGPSSNVANSLASRVYNIATQMIGPDIYQKVLWNSSDLSRGLMGDSGTYNSGNGSEKSDDYFLANTFLDNHPNNPGWACWGDDFAEEWVTLGGSAVAVRSTYMQFNLITGDHKSVGLPVSPKVFRDPTGVIGPPSMYAYGGCGAINDFDVLQLATFATPGATESTYDNNAGVPGAGDKAVVGQATPNLAATTARFVLCGFGYNFIRDDGVGGTATDRSEHLRDVLVYFENLVDPPIGIDPVAFSNSLDNAYPNPFNPTTTIK